MEFLKLPSSIKNASSKTLNQTFKCWLNHNRNDERIKWKTQHCTVM